MAAQRSIDGLTARIARRTKSVGRRFDRICNVLLELGYLSGEGDAVTVTPAGTMLAGIYTESDLLVAESLRRGVFDGLEPTELAGVVSTLLYEARRMDEDQPNVPRGAIEDTVERLTALHDSLSVIEQEQSLPAGRGVDRGLVWATYRWAQGANLLTILTRNDITAGDFVRWTRQAIDLLGQIATVAPEPTADTARAAARLLDRGVVTYASAV